MAQIKSSATTSFKGEAAKVSPAFDFFESNKGIASAIPTITQAEIHFTNNTQKPFAFVYWEESFTPNVE